MAEHTIIETPDFELKFDQGHTSFTDAWGAECSMSLASSILPRIWLGMDRTHAGQLDPKLSAGDIEIINQAPKRMCLTRRQALAIGQALVDWAHSETDAVITSDDEQK